jgi:hypothetical protein
MINFTILPLYSQGYNQQNQLGGKLGECRAALDVMAKTNIFASVRNQNLF